MPVSDELAQLRAELEAAQAYGDQQRNRAKTAEVQIEALANEAARLRAANDSLNMQLQDRVKLEHDQRAYIECAKEKRDWVQKCAGLTRNLARAVELLNMIDRGHPDVAAFLAEQEGKAR